MYSTVSFYYFINLKTEPLVTSLFIVNKFRLGFLGEGGIGWKGRDGLTNSVNVM